MHQACMCIGLFPSSVTSRKGYTPSVADDLARSIVDQRFDRQIARMTDWKQGFTARGVEACIKYLVEGQLEDYVVACADGCGGVLRCGYPTVEECKVGASR